MPIGSLCRACGAKLAGDVGWCTTCFEPITPYARRERLHGPGAFVGSQSPTPRTSRWRAGPTTFGPVGRILITIGVLAPLPWGGMGGLSTTSVLQMWFLMGWVGFATLVLRHVWKRERVADDTPPSAIERFRAHHPVLGRPIHLGAGGRIAVAAVCAGIALAAWFGLNEFDRYVWTVLVLVVGLGIFLATWNEV
jgi:hypothetical protein